MERMKREKVKNEPSDEAEKGVAKPLIATTNDNNDSITEG